MFCIHKQCFIQRIFIVFICLTVSHSHTPDVCLATLYLCWPRLNYTMSAINTTITLVGCIKQLCLRCLPYWIKILHNVDWIKAQGHHFLDPWPELIPPRVFNQVHKLGDDTHWDSGYQVIFKPVHKSRRRVPSESLLLCRPWTKFHWSQKREWDAPLRSQSLSRPSAITSQKRHLRGIHDRWQI